MRVLSIPVAQAAEYVPDFSSTTTTADYIRHSAQEHGADPDSLVATLTCESKLDPSAVGDYGTSFGIAQIHLPAHEDITKAEALDPQWSIDWAAEQFAEGNQRIWTCYRKLSALN